ncbi:hypothetical protein Ssi03_67150 [Sphaerisporangium siamense]|uniref:Uncharacterized protein n=1 Tax=Sphaerisporangium siamense TaxID=795645 RepID=A0A7W7DDT3_9ACTN|nr:hypothetical protein [Sphaerisporangium siamense]MBB4704776.1 hypothetical protein [Sphaerisporangium siamense]GII88725.1 hypothetical protein Ssi03_67150 [Sphaerisporangium siamense]
MSTEPGGGRAHRTAGEAYDAAVGQVTRHEELVRLLAEEFARADVSLRELQTRADRAGGTRLPRATCSDMLAGRRFPKKAVMVAFLRACRVPEERLPAWERAWERVRIAHLPAAYGTNRTFNLSGGIESATSTSEQAPTEPVRTEPPQAEAARTGPPPTDPTRARAHPTEPAPAKPARARPARVRGSLRRRLVAVLCVVAAMVILVAGAVVWKALHGVTDDGRAFGPGGSSRFTIKIDPANGGVRLIRRLDANVPWQRAAISVDGVRAGEWKPLRGGTYGWLDQSVDIPPALTEGRSSLTLTNTFVSSVWDFNEFFYLAQQKINGAWSTADTLDVGNARSEAAHGYHITRETFHGTRTFDYPPSGRHIG